MPAGETGIPIQTSNLQGDVAAYKQYFSGNCSSHSQNAQPCFVCLYHGILQKCYSTLKSAQQQPYFISSNFLNFPTHSFNVSSAHFAVSLLAAWQPVKRCSIFIQYGQRSTWMQQIVLIRSVNLYYCIFQTLKFVSKQVHHFVVPALSTACLLVHHFPVMSFQIPHFQPPPCASVRL